MDSRRSAVHRRSPNSSSCPRVDLKVECSSRPRSSLGSCPVAADDENILGLGNKQVCVRPSRSTGAPSSITPENAPDPKSLQPPTPTGSPSQSKADPYGTWTSTPEATVGRHLPACNYHRGANYLEIDVDIASSGIAKAILRLALRYVTSVTIDMGFLVEAQTEDELPERLVGAVRICQMEMSSATVIDATPVSRR
ncbi:hypothetical protein ACLB2K_009240 [Fragaria x ananassa]